MLRRMEDLVLFLHLLGVLLFVAGVVVAGVVFESARRRERADEVALLLGLSRHGVTLVALGGALLFVCGFWLMGLEEIGLDTAWLGAATGIFLAAVALGALGGQRPKRARELATRLAEEGGAVTPELRALLDDRASRATNYFSAFLVLVVLALMVFKP
jgi:hypothetical protein